MLKYKEDYEMIYGKINKLKNNSREKGGIENGRQISNWGITSS